MAASLATRRAPVTSGLARVGMAKEMISLIEFDLVKEMAVICSQKRC